RRGGRPFHRRPSPAHERRLKRHASCLAALPSGISNPESGITLMQPFVNHRGGLAVLDWRDVNTDLIIPARYLKRIERTGFGPLLFADKHYGPDAAPPPDQPEKHGPEAPDFPLSDSLARGDTILVVGRNFGCGS